MPKRANKIVGKVEIVKISEGPKELLEWFRLLNMLPRDYAKYKAEVDRIHTECLASTLNDLSPNADEPYLQKYRQLVGPRLAKELAGRSLFDAIDYVERLYSAGRILHLFLSVVWVERLSTPAMQIISLLMEPIQ